MGPKNSKLSSTRPSGALFDHQVREKEIESKEKIRMAEIADKEKARAHELEKEKIALAKLQAELEKAGYEEQIARAKAEADAKATKLANERKQMEEKHRQDIEEFQSKMAKERTEHMEMMQSKDIESLRDRYVYLIDARSKLLPILLKQQSVSMKKLRTLRALQLQLMQEECRLEEFSDERDDDSVLRVVLYGPTGHGKSTFSNRLTGDRSPQGDKGEFSVGHGVKSLTMDINKFVVRDVYRDKEDRPLTISITDQPGRDDTEGRDRQFANNLVEYLRGIEFVNAFILVKTMSPKRWAETYQKMLIELTEMVGTKVWEHVIVVLTHAGDGRACTKKYMSDVREMLAEKVDMGGFDVSKLPIIPIELYETAAGEHTYEKVMNFIITNLVPKCGRFSCDGLVSPIVTLANKCEAAEQAYEDEKLVWRGHLATDEQYAKQLKEFAEKLKSLDGSFVVDEKVFEYPRDGVKLSLDDEIPEHDRDDVFNALLSPSGDGDLEDEKSDDSHDTDDHPLWRCKRCSYEDNDGPKCGGCSARFDEFGEETEAPMWQCMECAMMNEEADDACFSCFTPRQEGED